MYQHLELRQNGRNTTLASRGTKSKQVSSYLPHLNLFRSFSDSVSSVMPPDVLERLLSAVAISTVDLHRPIRRLAAQPIAPVVAHGDVHAELELHFPVRHGVHFGGRLADQVAQHHALRRELDNGELDALVVRQRLPEGFALVRMLDGFVDAVFGRSETRRCLPDPVLMYECLSDGETIVYRPDDPRLGHPNVSQ